MLWEIDQSEQVLKWYRDFIVKAPEDLTGFFAFLVVPPVAPFPEHLHLKKMCGVIWNYTGPMEKAEEVYKPVRSFLKPALDFVGPMPFPVLQTLFDPDPANKGLVTKWAKDYWKAVHPYSAGGAYINFMMEDEGQERVKASYKYNYDKLARVKSKYDPHNLFRVNQNIAPAIGQ